MLSLLNAQHLSVYAVSFTVNGQREDIQDINADTFIFFS
jgi:hypothetical protein